MNLAKWLALVQQLAPVIASAIPGVPPSIVPYIGPAIQIAETIPGASGTAKLAAATQIVQVGIAAAATVKPTINADALNQAIASGVNAVVAGVNAVHTTTNLAAAQAILANPNAT